MKADREQGGSQRIVWINNAHHQQPRPGGVCGIV